MRLETYFTDNQFTLLLKRKGSIFSCLEDLNVLSKTGLILAREAEALLTAKFKSRFVKCNPIRVVALKANSGKQNNFKQKFHNLIDYFWMKRWGILRLTKVALAVSPCGPF